LRTIALQPGTYTASTGEVFPLVVRGVSLLGAGSDRTILRGQGLADRHGLAGTGFFHEAYQATLVIGDPVAQTTLSGISIQAVDSAPSFGVAVICDRGNATGPPNAVSPSNTRIHGANISGNYVWGILVTGNGAPAEPTGCNLTVTGSTLTGMNAKGIW